MVPWPIALLSLFYGVNATIAASAIWNRVAGVSPQPLWGPLVWLALAASAMCGLPLLRSWGRTCALWASGLMGLMTLAVAGVLAGSGRPLGGLLVTLAASVHVLIIRYLRRPSVRAWFGHDGTTTVASDT